MSIPSKVNLHDLACELAKMDGKSPGSSDYDENVIGAETTIANLGRKLRAVKVEEAMAILHAITERAGS
jgi:hypothetical protein